MVDDLYQEWLLKNSFALKSAKKIASEWVISDVLKFRDISYPGFFPFSDIACLQQPFKVPHQSSGRSYRLSEAFETTYWVGMTKSMSSRFSSSANVITRESERLGIPG